jgi:hypothetical protein
MSKETSNDNRKDETYPIMKCDSYDQRHVTVVTDEKHIRTLRITSSEYIRLLERSEKEYRAKSDTLWNRLALAFTIVIRG